jgi:hypothetical protein
MEKGLGKPGLLEQHIAKIAKREIIERKTSSPSFAESALQEN